MIPGDTITIYCGRMTAAGAASTGKVSADFVTTCRGVALTQSAFAEGATVGGYRWYSWTVTLPAGVGNLGLSVSKASGTDFLFAPWLNVESADLTSIAGAIAGVSAPIVTVTQGTPNGDLQFTLPKGDYATVTWTVYNASGTAIPLNGYNNPQFGVKSQDQTATIYLQTTGITMDALGLVTLIIPETASFYAALATGVDQTTLYFSLTADEAANTARTRTLGQGTIIVRRREV